MNQLLLSLTLCLFLFNCSKGSDGGSDSSPSEQTATENQTPSPNANSLDSVGSSLPNQAFTFDTDILFINMSVAQEDKVEKAAELVKKVIATEEFRKRILNHTYNGKKTFVDNGGYSNAQIYQKILDGAEKLQSSKNNTMDLEIELYTQSSSTVGYTYPNTKRVWMNTKFFNTYKPYQVARNLMHEWLHKVGFGHAVSYSTSRDYSVPYAVGEIIQALAQKID